jgi:hypothetical protein
MVLKLMVIPIPLVWIISENKIAHERSKFKETEIKSSQALAIFINCYELVSLAIR